MNKLFEAIKSKATLSINVRKGEYSELNKEEYEAVHTTILEAGAEEVQQLRHLSSNTHYAEYKYEGVKITVWVNVTPSKEEQIAKLRKELAELEGTTNEAQEF